MNLLDRLKRGWNVFTSRDPTNEYESYYFGTRPDKKTISLANGRSIIAPILNRIAIDAAQIDIMHAEVNEEGKYANTVKDQLNFVLTKSANKDQTARAFRQELFLSLLDEGVVAVVPVDTDVDPKTGEFKIESLRVGRIIGWSPDKVTVDLYNDQTGLHQNVTLSKSFVSIVENPFYAVMNAPNSTLKRLIYKLNLLDTTDKDKSSGKLDLIIQLPYQTKTEARKIQADKRRQAIIDQLTGSDYGIAYIDATERITQLNRSVENNLYQQVESLTASLYSQLGMSKEIFEGTANEAVLLNYYNTTIEPLISSVVDEFNRKFIDIEEIDKKRIVFFRDPFKLVPVNQIAEIADKFTRNEILSSNEIRSIIGFKPSNDPRADELRNKNLNQEAGTSGERPTTVANNSENQNE